MSEPTSRTAELLSACFGDDEQRATIAARLESEAVADNAHSELNERVWFSIIRYIFDHHDQDYVDLAFDVARKDWRDMLMSADHGEDVKAHLSWAARMIREQPRVVITRPPGLRVEVDDTGWAKCPSCGFASRSRRRTPGSVTATGAACSR